MVRLSVLNEMVQQDEGRTTNAGVLGGVGCKLRHLQHTRCDER